MPNRAPTQHIIDWRPRQFFVNRFTKFFFIELNKGFASPWILLSSGIFFSYFAWRVTEAYVEERRRFLPIPDPIQRIPMKESHNIFWGLRAPVEPVDKVIVEERVADVSRYIVNAHSAAAEDELQRPNVIYSQVSEQYEEPSQVNPTGELDVVCLELSEYDPHLQDDVYYRSVHYVSRHSSPPGQNSKNDHRGKEPFSGADDTLSQAASGGANLSRSPSSASASYLKFMPGEGKSVIHGIIKCRGVTTLNNCVPYTGHLESEISRKLLLSLAPVHVLRSASKVFLPVRFTTVKEVPVETLVIGLHSGEMPRWLSVSFPNFKVNVIEVDGALVGICRRFLGFRESNNLTLRIGNPIDYLRSLAANLVSEHDRASGNKASKRYDLVLIDAVDGSGQLSAHFGHLEVLNNLRNCMTSNGCVAITLPNKDSTFLYHMVQNWRMAFAGRPVVLVHCYTVPYTILMTFQDDAGRGKANMGTIANVNEFKDLLRAHLKHYGQDRVRFDLTNEVQQDNFRVLLPGERYEKAAFLPHGHPELLKNLRSAEKGQIKGWNTWLRRWASKYTTLGQHTDVRLRDPSDVR